MGGKPNSAGRTVVLSSFLLGGPSGSGVATTVMIGTVAYPMMAKAGFEKNAAGGLLAAGGLGAILSPPVLGAAAFLIAEFLKISYLDVIWMATIPTCLYYLSLLFMVELDAKKFGAKDVTFEPDMSLRPDDQAIRLPLRLAARRRRVHDHRLLAVAVGVLRHGVHLRAELPAPGNRAGAWQSWCKALADGSIGALNAATTCACAGIVVGVVTLTGLGLKFSSIVISYAGGSLLLTAIYTSLIVWIIGLAVPVTASYIICAVIAAPALIKLGVPDLRRAHVHLLLRGAVRGVAADGAVAVRGRRHHRRRSLQDHAAILEIHAAGVPGAVRVRARPAGRRPAAGDPEGRLVGRYPRDHDQDHLRPAGAGGVRPELGAATKYASGARPASAIRAAAGVSEPASRRSSNGSSAAISATPMCPA